MDIFEELTATFIFNLVNFVIISNAVTLKADLYIVEYEDEYYDEDEEYWEDDYDECGYNPYLGCYDFDC